MRRPTGSALSVCLWLPAQAGFALSPLQGSDPESAPLITPARVSLALSYQRTDPSETTADNTPAQAPAPTDPAATDAADLAAKLQNPVADLISVPMQFNFDTGYGPKDGDRLTLNIQPVIPFAINDDWNLISRTIVPIVYQDSIADGIDSDFGIGDVVQSFFFSPKEPVDGWILGFGPVALLPTGTTPGLRSEQFGLGPTGVALRQEGGWTYGALANHIWSINESDDNRPINATFLQPFISYTWPSATSVTLNAEMTYDWTREESTIPLNVVIGQLTHIGDQPVQFAVGGRYYADSPSGGPEWGLRFTMTLLFPR